MKRARPKEHVRRYKSGKTIKVNKGRKKVKVSAYTRKQRKLGKRIRYKKAGTFLVAHDELGNFRGSKVIPLKTKKKTEKLKKSKTKKTTIKRKRVQNKSYTELKELDTDYYLGRISQDEWLDTRKSLLGLF